MRIDPVKVTFIVKDLSDAFYNGSEFLGKGYNSMTPDEQFAKLCELSRDLNIKMKVGSDNSFRVRVDLNMMRREPHDIISKLEPRRGYKLATFTFSQKNK
jgi:hypothetical protein